MISKCANMFCVYSSIVLSCDVDTLVLSWARALFQYFLISPFQVEIASAYLYLSYSSVTSVMPYRNKDRTHHHARNKLHTFYNISYLNHTCFYPP